MEWEQKSPREDVVEGGVKSFFFYHHQRSMGGKEERVVRWSQDLLSKEEKEEEEEDEEEEEEEEEDGVKGVQNFSVQGEERMVLVFGWAVTWGGSRSTSEKGKLEPLDLV